MSKAQELALINLVNNNIEQTKRAVQKLIVTNYLPKQNDPGTKMKITKLSMVISMLADSNEIVGTLND